MFNEENRKKPVVEEVVKGNPVTKEPAKKVVKVEKPKKVEKVKEVSKEEVSQTPENVTVHEDRRDSGTNYNESPELPSLNDPGQS